MSEEVTLRRRNPKNLGGRPRLEEIEYLTPEMEEMAQLTRAGFANDEIADRLKCTTEKVSRVLANPLVKARVKKLTGNRIDEISHMRDRLWDAVVASAIRMAGKDELPVSQMEDILKRLDPFERLTIMTENERKLMANKKDGQQLLGSHTPEDPKETTIFKTIEMKD